MSDFSDQSFIQGFLEEADEHLDLITGVLLALEQTSGVPGGDLPGGFAGKTQAEQVGELYRALHSIKGLSTMVGLMPAADLSHAMESVVREIQHNRLENSPLVIDSLLGAAKMLRVVVDTLRTTGKPAAGAPPVDIQAQRVLLEQLAERGKLPLTLANQVEVFPTAGLPALDLEHLPPELAALLGETEQRQIHQAQASGRNVYLVIFTPSNQLAAQGMNVTAIRQQLTAQAQVLKALPLVEGKHVRFIFLVTRDGLQPTPASPGLEWMLLAGASLAGDADGVADAAGAADQPAGAVEQPAQAAFEPAPPGKPAGGIPSGQATTAPTGAGFNPSIRVDIHRLDEVMRLVGELVVTRSRLSDAIQRLEYVEADVQEVLDDSTGRIERQVRDLRQAVMRVRLVPLAEVFGRMPLAVRDLAHHTGKQVRLVMHGEATEIDKALIDRLLDPLLHLVRNAIAHGIEMPEERRQAGKDPQGTITLTGQAVGDHVVVTVADDGCGIRIDQVLQQARQGRWIDSSAAPDMEQVLELLSRPGFSTQAVADMGAGRGMGMSVVRQAIATLGGTVGLHTTPGAGTTFTIRLPLTLAIIDALIVRCSQELYALPQSAISEAIEIDAAQVVSVLGQELVTLRGAALPLVHLEQVFHLAHASGESVPARRVSYGLLTGSGEARTALVVDQIVGLREAVIRPISDPLIARPGIAGATELGDGSLVLVLDVPGVLRASRNGNGNLKGAGDR